MWLGLGKRLKKGRETGIGQIRDLDKILNAIRDYGVKYDGNGIRRCIFPSLSIHTPQISNGRTFKRSICKTFKHFSRHNYFPFSF